MKAIKITVAAAAALILLAGCQKDALTTMTGSYTYKTSGSVSLVATALTSLTPEQLAGYKMTGGTIDTLTVALTPEQGQMNIVEKDKEISKVLVSWNDILGNVSTCDATVDGINLSLQPSTKSAQLTDGKDTIGGGFVTFSGKGTLYSNMLIIPMTYNGSFTINNVPMTVVKSEVQCVAKAN